MCQQQLQLNYSRRAYTTHTSDPVEHTVKVTREIAPWGSIGHLLHKATLPRPGDIADLLYTEKQSAKMRRQRNTFQTKKTGQNARKKKTTEGNEDKQCSRCRFQNTGYKFAQ